MFLRREIQPMVVRCVICKACSVFHAWIGVKSRITEGCSCPNQVWINNKEQIQAQNYEAVEVWHSKEQNWISYERYCKLWNLPKVKYLNSTKDFQDRI